MKKIIFILLFVIACCVLFFFMKSGTQEFKVENKMKVGGVDDTHNKAIMGREKKHEQAKLTADINSSNQNGDVDEKVDKLRLLLSGEDGREIREWQRDRGHFFFDVDTGELENSDYDSYSDEILRSLASQGDKRASLLLGERLAYSMEPGNRDEAKTLLIDASIRGYSASLIHIGNMKLMDFVKFRNSNELIEAKSAAIEAQAWFHVAMERGDPHAKTNINSLKNMYNISFTPEDKKIIRDTTYDIYSTLTTQRELLGLPPFNNDYPPALDIFIDLTTAQ